MTRKLAFVLATLIFATSFAAVAQIVDCPTGTVYKCPQGQFCGCYDYSGKLVR